MESHRRTEVEGEDVFQLITVTESPEGLVRGQNVPFIQNFVHSLLEPKHKQTNKKAEKLQQVDFSIRELGWERPRAHPSEKPSVPG